MYLPRDGWGDFAEAIVLRAVEDYRHVNNRLRENPDDLRLQEQKEEIEEFFLSAWFRVLTDLNGKRLLHRLQVEMKGSEDKE